MIDLRSDTVTEPTEEMRREMAEAKVGDDVYGDDPTMNELEALAASVAGKESALFLPSGTMGNQVAIMTHTNRGDEIICGHASHIFADEVGAAAVLSSVSVNTVKNPDDKIYKEDILFRIRGLDIHQPRTSLLCLENALATGRVMSIAHMKELYDVSKEHGLSVHTDGARVFNAALSLGVEMSEIAKYTDSLMFCLSKGLCAPVGSMLAGSAEFIDRARKNRKMLGGGMRQAGILAAAGIVALNKMTGRLGDDHRNIKLLADELSDVKGIEVEKDALDINMLFFVVKRENFDIDLFKDYMKEKGILINDADSITPAGPCLRFVTHNGVSAEDAVYAGKTAREYFTAAE